MDVVRSNVLDFYFSFNLGLMFAVAGIGFIHMYQKFKNKKREAEVFCNFESLLIRCGGSAGGLAEVEFFDKAVKAFSVFGAVDAVR